MKNLNKITALLLTVSFLAAGCGGGTSSSSKKGGPIVLKFWKPFENSQRMELLFQEFTKIYPNVSIVYTKKNVDNYEQDLLEALASGTGPDIFSIHNDWLPPYLNKIVPAPDKTFIYKDYKDQFIDTVVEDFTVDGKIYGTAMGVDSLALLYNKDILGSEGIATPAKTWQELADHVQKIRRLDSKGYFTRSGVALGTNSNINRAVDILYLFMLQQRVAPFSADSSRPQFGSSIRKDGKNYNPGQVALEFFTSFANPMTPNYNWNMKSDYSIDAFVNGKTAYLITYAYQIPAIVQKNPNLNFDIAPVPQPNLDDTAVNFSDYWGEVVSKQSPPQAQAAAWELLKFLSSKNVLDKFYATGKQASSRKDLIDTQVNDPIIGVFANANLTSKPFLKLDQKKMDGIFSQMIDNVILNGKEVPDALSIAQQQAEAMVRQIETGN
jgi:ABC-type glycerol-3-phosphate transport system substrate-binding protein